MSDAHYQSLFIWVPQRLCTKIFQVIVLVIFNNRIFYWLYFKNNHFQIAPTCRHYCRKNRFNFGAGLFENRYYVFNYFLNFKLSFTP